MIVESKHNQPKVRTKDKKKKKQQEGTKFAYPTVKAKQKNLVLQITT